jgi:hypothetical protein
VRRRSLGAEEVAEGDSGGGVHGARCWERESEIEARGKGVRERA